MSVDKAGNDEPVGGKRASIEIAGLIAHVEELARGGDPSIAYDEGVVFAQLAADERPRAAHQLAYHTRTPFLTTAAARLPPNCQPNSRGESICNATKSAGPPMRSDPASTRSECAAARVTAYSASAAESPKSLRP